MARRDRNVFTIMIVPHAETKVFTFRLSTIAFQAICYGLVCLFLFMIILARSYQTMLSNMWELEELRLVNRDQRAQIEQLVQETQSLEQRMVLLDELDKQVREMMELESYQASGSSLASLPVLPETPSGSVAIASSEAIGGSDLPDTVPGFTVSRDKINEARGALGTLGQIDEKMGAQTESLQEVRVALSESMTYVSAKPSGVPAFGYISSRFGYRQTRFGSGVHTGYDFAGKYGSPIVATADGTVIFAGWGGSLGNMVEIEHAYGWSTVYGHCAKLAVEVGDRVRAGEVVGFIGSTGKSTGPHVHYEVRINGQPVNPRYYLSGS